MSSLENWHSPLSPGHLRFLGERFQKVEGGKAAPGHRGSYAVVRQDHQALGLVAVDDELGIWYTPRAEYQAELRRNGFCHSRSNVLAALYFDLPLASSPPATAAAPASAAGAPPALLRLSRREAAVIAGAVLTGGRTEIAAAVAQAG
jgi:hypothetical protein